MSSSRRLESDDFYWYQSLSGDNLPWIVKLNSNCSQRQVNAKGKNNNSNKKIDIMHNSNGI